MGELCFEYMKDEGNLEPIMNFRQHVYKEIRYDLCD